MRWTQTDKNLKLTYKEIKRLFNDLKSDLEDLYKSLDLNFDELDNLASSKNIRKCERHLTEKNKTMLLGVFGIKSIKTNRDVLNVLFYVYHSEFYDKIYKISRDLFRKVSKDSTDIAKKDMPFKVEYLSWKEIEPMTMVLGYTYLEYLNYLSLLGTQETLKQAFFNLYEEKPLDIENNVLKEQKRVLNVNEDKFSGVMHDTAIKVGNETYVAPLLKENHQVKFVNIDDNRTTPMCRSLNGQIFNTKDKNSFDRIFDGEKKHFEIDGLVSGVNLPPITNFVHHCRSYVVYVK